MHDERPGPNAVYREENGSQAPEQSQLSPHPVMPQFYGTEDERHGRLIKAFDATAPHYDSINWLMSFGSDGSYRRGALLRAGLRPGMRVLDVGCGTGMTAAAARSIVGEPGIVVGVDPSGGMLAEAVKRARVDHPLRGTAEELPVRDRQFDLVSMTYALRHVTDLVTAFREFRRVLKPGGKVLILEMTTPHPGLRYRLLKAHVKYVVPTLAMMRARSQAAHWLYRYCWESHAQCVRPEQILDAMDSAGFHNAGRAVILSIFSEYLAEKQ